MKKIESLTELSPDYLNTDALLKTLDFESCTFHENDKVITLNFRKPQGSLLLTVEELTEMNRPSFITRYQMVLTRLSKEDVLAALKEEFGRELKYRVRQ